MNNFFDNFYNFSGFGPEINSEPVSATVLNKYKNKLPDRLLEYWATYGFSGWGNGMLWTVNPSDYTDIINHWLENTPFINNDNYHVIARTAFGSLIIWGENSGQSIEVISCYGMIFPSDASKKLKQQGGDKLIDIYLATTTKKSLDIQDVDSNPLFERAIKKLGMLQSDEMYSFVPSLLLGGEAKLNNIEKVKIFEHLSFLAGLEQKQIMQDITLSV
ncbi:MAG: DUF1851 domain-containing protein [Alteromonadales bacterium]|nr:DUF1851 domain-containing protein [Alteromonadales bacterium]